MSLKHHLLQYRFPITEYRSTWTRTPLPSLTLVTTTAPTPFPVRSSSILLSPILPTISSTTFTSFFYFAAATAASTSIATRRPKYLLRLASTLLRARALS